MDKALGGGGYLFRTRHWRGGLFNLNKALGGGAI